LEKLLDSTLRLSTGLMVALFALTLSVSACAEPGVSEEDRQAIEETIRAYLPKFAEAYATGDASVLDGLAAPKEVSSLQRRIRELEEEGRVIRPTPVDLTVEQVTVWGYSNAFATTLEEWDLVVLATGSERELSRDDGQQNRVRYQLQRQDDGWWVLYRTTEITFE
jgi:hypothetical protein